MKYGFLIAILVLVSCGPSIMTPELEKEVTGKRVIKVMEKYKIDYKDISFEDEPPFKLRRIYFRNINMAPNGGIVYLNLKYDISLFSVEREWKKDAVLQAEITSIDIEPAPKENE
jgi:hypothetical protein